MMVVFVLTCIAGFIAMLGIVKYFVDELGKD